MEQIIHTPVGAKIRHLVIGHSQIRGCWNYKYDENELNFDMDWICVSGGKARNLLELLKLQMRESQIPLRVSAIIWQNSIPDLSFADVEKMIEEIEVTLDDYPQHKVALPECQFVPAQAQLFEHIAKINLILADFNERQGFNRYPLFRSTMKQTKQALRVKQSDWLEYQNKTGPGYHIANKTKFTKFIRKFHANNLENAAFVQWKPSTLDITKVLAVISPPDKMVDPSKAPEDLREVLRDNKQWDINCQPETRKRPRSPLPEAEELVEQAPPKKPKLSEKPEVNEEEEIKITFQNDRMEHKKKTKASPKVRSSKATPEASGSKETSSSNLYDWLKEGNSQGYMNDFLKSMEKTMKGNILRKLKQKKKDKKRKHVKTSKKHKKGKKKSRKEESSESSSSSSSSSSDSSDSSSSKD